MKTFLSLLALGSFTLGYAGRSLQEARSPDHAAFQLGELVERAQSSGLGYLPFLDRSTLSAGLYRLAAGATDRQSPHELDELTRRVREWRTDIPIVLCSGFLNVLASQRASEAGVTAVETKPIVAQQLASRIRALSN